LLLPKQKSCEDVGHEGGGQDPARSQEEGPQARRPGRHLEAEAEALKGAAWLEDLHIWQMEKVKTTKKGKTTYVYWMASWREDDRVRNVHIGSCAKLDEETALLKARKMKAEALGLSAYS
jgi:hypothetical protein